MNEVQRTEQPENDWQLNKSLLECSSQLCLCEYLSDVIFIFPSENPIIRLPAHKFILALRSPVFEVMFYGSLAEKNQEVSIVDVTSAAFTILLRFLYTDRAEVTDVTVVDTMHASHKYRVPLLSDLCASFMESRVSIDNVCSILEQTMLYELPRLNAKCLAFIEENMADIVTHNEFTEISLTSLKTILESDNLFLDELDIYKAVLVWADAECQRQELEATPTNKRHVLGDAFYHLRIPCISLKQFAETVSKDGLLTDQECLDIFRYHAPDVAQEIMFASCKKRNITTLMVTRLEGQRRNNVCKGWRSELVKFRTSEDCKLTGLGLFNIITRDFGDDFFANSHIISVEVLDTALSSTNSGSDSDSDDYRPVRPPNPQLITFTTMQSFSSERTPYITMEFTSPLQLHAERWYSVQVNLFSAHKNLPYRKSCIELIGNSTRSKITLPNGMRVSFQGQSTYGPIHSLYLRHSSNKPKTGKAFKSASDS